MSTTSLWWLLILEYVLVMVLLFFIDDYDLISMVIERIFLIFFYIFME